MEPFYKAFYTLKPMITDISVEIVYDDFIVERDGFNDNAIDEIYAQGGILTTERFDIRINNIYHENFKEELEAAFKEFEVEINKNLRIELLHEKIPAYIERLRKELTTWNNKISEHEIEINSKKKWFYVNKNINLEFLKSDGISNSIIDKISEVFLFQKNNIIKVLKHLKKAESDGSITRKIVLPEKSMQNMRTPKKVIETLDIYQTALFFYYLRKYKGILNYTDTSLAKLVSTLTGHSDQNIRTEKGFGAISFIISGKVMNKNHTETPNYNLTTIKQFLQKIIVEIDREISNEYQSSNKL